MRDRRRCCSGASTCFSATTRAPPRTPDGWLLGRLKSLSEESCRTTPCSRASCAGATLIWRSWIDSGTRMVETKAEMALAGFVKMEEKREDEAELVFWGIVNQDYECLAMEPTDAGFHIYGGVAQVNYLVGFDVTRKTVSFKSAECGR
ncbi:hypothetical protein SASPL_150385 [Salvia splendens]|uniref:Peptidase A1 domain-containing protein n=1 Tax=Salvia splendens TaxID=180675 RepID=A0A8X8Z2F3_SALSN|nr:hypothetical protein SASPL_150385 [Salvia splendens]